MLDFLKRKKNPSNPSHHTPPEASQDTSKEPSLFQRMKTQLTGARQSITQGLERLFLGKKTIDESLLKELETVLLKSDMGLPVTQKLIAELTQALHRKEINDTRAVYSKIKTLLTQQLQTLALPLQLSDTLKPMVILMVGVNGSGKTTTIGKLTQYLQQAGKKVLLAAGDTFRAAAVEQLKVWGERNQTSVIAQHAGADSASVIFDAYQAAKARHIDVLIADTAGRLHTQGNLMEELKKICRVLQKQDPALPHETLLVLDATTGQNALMQAQKFHEAIRLTGIVVTKLDGTAKGGILFNLSDTLKLPVRFIGLGEGIQDLKPFDPALFVDALFSDIINPDNSSDSNHGE